MSNSLIYSKHSANDRCGVAYFAARMASQLGGRHVQNFHGFGKCEDFFINMDILELSEDDVQSLLAFIRSGMARRSILLMHDYRFSYLEDELIYACDYVLNLSGEPALNDVAPAKTTQLFTPSLIEDPVFGWKKTKDRPVSISFGFFTPRKKSFKMYISFYEYMMEKHPDWFHIIVASAHTGTDMADTLSLRRLLMSDSILVLDFLPNTLLSDLIHVADMGVFYYPTGIMINNAGPMALFQQGKTVLTTYGNLSPKEYLSFTLDGNDLNSINFSDLDFLHKHGINARKYYERELSWEKFIEKMYAFIGER